MAEARLDYNELVAKHRHQRDALQNQIESEENPKIMREDLIAFLQYDVSSEESCMSPPRSRVPSWHGCFGLGIHPDLENLSIFKT